MAACRKRSTAQSLIRFVSGHSGLTIALLLCSSGPENSLMSGQAVQTPPLQATPAPAAFAGYDIVSVKPNVSGSGSMRISSRETTFQATNTSLKTMLVNAYGVRDALIFGLPKWAESARWDINAKIVDLPQKSANEKLSREQSTEAYRTKVRSILTDRFKLTAHKETRIVPIYELTLMPGPLRFKKSEPSEEGHSGTNSTNGTMTGTAITLDSFVFFLSNLVGRTVIDKTGLEGTYNLSLKWSADELAEAAKETGTGDRPPEIYTALQEQLGFKLVSGKGPSEVLVVDTVEQPVVD